MEHVTSHKRIAQRYFQAWFWIDSFSIFPIEPIMDAALKKAENGGEGKGGVKINILAKFPRIAKLYQLVRFIRLARLARLMKKKRHQKSLESTLKLREGIQRLIFFGVFILLSIHIFACLWIFLANMNKERNWLTLKRESIVDSGEALGGHMQTYFISLYFVTQTITTVGYGDVSASGTVERIFVVLLMLIGVFAFTFASGSLASIMQNVDSGT